ncbi:MAG: MerR family transcriptional regulator [Planktomarina sp.]
MISIGQLSKRVGVKVPTIRYYEDQGLMPQVGRSAGNQRRYDAASIERLSFIKHARDLGFSMKSIAALIALQAETDHNCGPATQIARRSWMRCG